MTNHPNRSKRFDRECPRCVGLGRFDRGVCFQCKGRRFVKQKTKPSLPAHTIEIAFDDGSKNTVTMYSHIRAYAVAAIEERCAAKGWKFTIVPALFTGSHA